MKLLSQVPRRSSKLNIIKKMTKGLGLILLVSVLTLQNYIESSASVNMFNDVVIDNLTTGNDYPDLLRKLFYNLFNYDVWWH